ncbi:MAG: DNA primase [Candidatus Nealsonbacteria bacterium]|nr:DNA primase [Candidatus Nealsonbacteria bacterium]
MLASPIEEIKNRLDIVDLVGAYIKLQKAGINFRAVCPFHSEKKPSFFVSPSRQIWHCFGCQTGGDIFKFVMQIEGVEFGDALSMLAKKAGIELKREDPKLKTERQRLYEINELACRFFEKQLNFGSKGQEAKEYLLSRKISEDSLKKWRLGYSPEEWSSLSDFLAGQGYKGEEVEKAGLAIKNESGKHYDRFRARIMFPVFDLNSQVVGFGGRVFGERANKEIAKYVNTPAAILYDKGRILYGLDKAKVDIRKKDFVILVEGYVDAIMVSQAGSSNVVATSGTALTGNQLKILSRYTNNLFTAFDMDVAGNTATKRGIDLAQAAGFNIRVITMPQAKDPADVVSADPQKWGVLVDSSCSILEFYFENTFSRFNPKVPEEKKNIAQILLPIIKRIPNQIERFSWIQSLARKLGVRDEDVEEELKKVKDENNQYFSQAFEEKIGTQNIAQKTRKELLEESLISLIIRFPESSSLIQEEHLSFLSPKTREILDHLRHGPEAELAGLPPHLQDSLSLLCFKAETEELSDADPAEEIQTSLKEIRSLGIKSAMDDVAKAIKKAEEEKDKDKVSNLIEQFQKISLQLREV